MARIGWVDARRWFMSYRGRIGRKGLIGSGRRRSLEVQSFRETMIVIESVWNCSGNHTHAGARTEAAVVIWHAHAAVVQKTEVGATWRVMYLVPIASIAVTIDPPNGVARTLSPVLD